jgi:hypothetical protein
MRRPTATPDDNAPGFRPEAPSDPTAGLDSKPSEIPGNATGEALRDAGLADLSRRVPSAEIEAAAAALVAGLRDLGGTRTAEVCWRRADHAPTGPAACLGAALASRRGWIVCAGFTVADTPRAHAGIVRRWRLAGGAP